MLYSVQSIQATVVLNSVVLDSERVCWISSILVHRAQFNPVSQSHCYVLDIKHPSQELYSVQSLQATIVLDSVMLDTVRDYRISSILVNRVTLSPDYPSHGQNTQNHHSKILIIHIVHSFTSLYLFQYRELYSANSI
jgi:hypothetical protein